MGWKCRCRIVVLFVTPNTLFFFFQTSPRCLFDLPIWILNVKTDVSFLLILPERLQIEFHITMGFMKYEKKTQCIVDTMFSPLAVLNCKCWARFRRRTFHEPNLVHWIKYMKSSASELSMNAYFNSERLDRKQFDRNEHFSPFEFCLATGPLSTVVERRLKQANE